MIGTGNWPPAEPAPKPDYIVSGSFLNELKEIQGGFFWLVGWFFSD